MSRKSPVYIRQFLADRDVGALLPTQRYVIRRLIRSLDPSRISTIVELGPGPGVATRPVLEVLPQTARYFAIEKNPAFLGALDSIADPRLEVIRGDARFVTELLASRGVTSVDAVIASLPFTFLTNPERAAIVDSVYSLLSDGGRFVIFHQFSRLMKPFVRERFEHVDVRFILRNVFPCFVLTGRKNASGGA